MTIGISALSVYLPRSRISRSAIADAHRWAVPTLAARGKGTISAANWDEDSVTMAHEAARRVTLTHTPTALQFCSTSMPFADRSHAALLNEALQLDSHNRTQDLGACARAASSALYAELAQGQRGTLIMAAEKRLAKPASTQEISQGDAAAALITGSDDLLAEYVAGRTFATDFVDHYRRADSDFDYAFEDRWVRDEFYLADAPTLIRDLLADNAIAASEVSQLVINAPLRVRSKIAQLCGLTDADVGLTSDAEVGGTGCVAPLLGLAEALPRASAGSCIVCVTFGQGVDVLVLRATANASQCTAFGDALATGERDDNYLRYLSHRGLIAMDWGKRAERDVRTAQSAYYRQRDQISGLVGGKCTACGTAQFPRTKACVNPECREFAAQTPYAFADLTGTIKSFTEDWQAYSPAPPLIYGNIVFEGGANIMMQFSDTSEGSVSVGDSVGMHFRIKDIDRARGYQRYFWKAIPVRGG
ncbi:MAG: zinc ribbon domain-containing protein [Pseudomonadota bacterium]